MNSILISESIGVVAGMEVLEDKGNAGWFGRMA